MKLSQAKTIEELATAVEEKLYKEWYYAIKYETYHHFLIFHVACPTDAFIEWQKKAKKKIKITEDMLALKDMFILDHIKIDLCNFLEPRKNDPDKYRMERAKILKEINK